MSELICQHCGEAVQLPSGMLLGPAPQPTAGETGKSGTDSGGPRPMTFEEQQEALYAILTSYEDTD